MIHSITTTASTGTTPGWIVVYLPFLFHPLGSLLILLHGTESSYFFQQMDGDLATSAWEKAPLSATCGNIEDDAVAAPDMNAD